MAHQLLCSLCDEVCSRFTHVMYFQSLDTEANKFFHEQLKDNPLISPLIKIPKQSAPMVYTICQNCKELLEETIVKRKEQLVKNVDEFNQVMGIKQEVQEDRFVDYKEVTKEEFEKELYSVKRLITYITDTNDEIVGYCGIGLENKMAYYIFKEE